MPIRQAAEISPQRFSLIFIVQYIAVYYHTHLCILYIFQTILIIRVIDKSTTATIIIVMKSTTTSVNKNKYFSWIVQQPSHVFVLMV